MDHQPVEFLLLDLHLDQLDPRERAGIEEQLRAHPALLQKSLVLGRVLRPLDFHNVQPPDNLADSVLRFVDENQTVQLAPNDERISMTSKDRGGRVRFVPVRDLLALAASLLLVTSLMVPGLSEFRSRSHRAMCTANLHRAAAGVASYMESFDGWLPYAGHVPASRWLPNGNADNFASNSRHVFLLLKSGMADSSADFICPASSTAHPLSRTDLRGRDDFDLADNITYDSLNLSGTEVDARPIGSMVYLADPNPLFADGKFQESVNPELTNSPLHRGRGQTVLNLDGSAMTMTTPIYGLRKDNIWLAGDIRRYEGTETPTRSDDIFLIPGIPRTDPRFHRESSSR